MTLQEAIKSGKPFKRKSGKEMDYLIINKEGYVSIFKYQFDRISLSKEDILATDWEIEEERISLSAAEIRAAFYSDEAAFAGDQWCLDDWLSSYFIEKVLDKLGFKGE